MTREMMLDDIKELLIELEASCYYEDVDLEFHTRSDCILTLIENRGMLPPEFMEFQGPSTECSIDPYKRVNEWEKE